MTAGADAGGRGAPHRRAPASPLRVLLLLGRSTGGIGTHVADLRARLDALGDAGRVGGDGTAGRVGGGVDVRIATDSTTADAFGWADALPMWPGAAGGPAAAAGRLARLRRWFATADVVHAHGHQAGLLAAAIVFGRARLWSGRAPLLSGRGAVSSGRAALRATHPPRHRPALIISLHNELPPLTGARARVAALASAAAWRHADLVTGASSDLVAAARAAGARRAELAEVPSPRVPRLLAAREPEREEARRGIREELGLDRQAPLVVTLSRIAPQKDLGTLVAASAHLPQTAWVVAGSGEPRLLDRLRAQAAALGAPVRFVGAVADPERLLLAADVFVLTSHWEARALVVQEAMAVGVPVVASAVGGIPDLLAGIGTLVPPGDPAAVAAAVAALLTDPAAAAAQGARGRERAGRWPDGSEAARRWLTVYRGLLA